MKRNKYGRHRLAPEAYDQLRLEVLKRDNWRCQWCGERTNLHVHHIRHRSQMGTDAEANLITLCADCHKQTHAGSQPADSSPSIEPPF